MPSQLSSLLSNHLLARVERLRLAGTRRLTNRARGEHLHGKGGLSNDFADYRNYVEGDDVRFVDWNIFARLNRPYLKQFRHEEEMHVVLLVDGSASMGFDGKFDLARRLAACFGVMGLFGQEKVSVQVFRGADGPLETMRPCTGRANLARLLAFLEGLAEVPGSSVRAGQAPGASPGGSPGASPGGNPGASAGGNGAQVGIERGIDWMLRLHRGRGVVVLLSDLLTQGDLRRAFNQLHSAGLEIFALQILAPMELDPEIDSDLRMLDSETEAVLDVTAGGELLALYQEYRQAYQRTLEKLCRQRGGRFLAASSQEPVATLVMDRLRRAGWISQG